MSEEKNIPPSASKPDSELMVDAPQAAEAMASEESSAGHHHFVGVEKESIDAKLIFGIVAGVTVIVVGLVILAFTITGVTSQELRAQAVAEVDYPELREANAAAAARLMGYDVVDAESGTFRIPIERAIDLMVNEHHANRTGGPVSNELKLVPSR